MTRLILVRHGQSIANAEHRFAGYSDFDLSPFGFLQAECAGEYLCTNEKIDKIYASDLLRAYNTALPAAKRLGLTVIPDERLREIYAGEWEGLTFEDIEKNFPEDFDLWRNDFSNARPTGGESVTEIFHRVNGEILRIAEENDKKTVMIGTHATVVRSFDCLSRGFGAERMCDVPFCKNAAINIFEYEGGRITPIRINITEHLEALESENQK